MDGMESILTSIKKMLGPSGDYTHFDPDIIMHINSVFMVLRQIGIGPKEGFFIEDDSACWSDFSDDLLTVHTVKTYIYLKVKLVFDPPQSATHMKALEQSIAEHEWRLNVEVDPKQS